MRWLYTSVVTFLARVCQSCGNIVWPGWNGGDCDDADSVDGDVFVFIFGMLYVCTLYLLYNNNMLLLTYWSVSFSHAMR